jgi:hypothetical protein
MKISDRLNGFICGNASGAIVVLAIGLGQAGSLPAEQRT